MKKSLIWLEKRIYSRARHIIALSEPIKASIATKSAKPITVIPNMADTDFYKPGPKDPVLEVKFDVQGKFVVSYIGAVGFANGLDYFMECARAAQNSGLPVKFMLCGEGGLVDHLKSVTRMLSLHNVTLIPFQNRQGVKEIMNVTDATFICYKPFPILETGSPNKYFDGLAAGKLILVNFNGWMKDEVESYQCGIALNHKNPHEFSDKLKPFLENKSLFEVFCKNARRLAEAKYSRKDLSRKFISLFDRAHITRSPSR